MTTETTAPESQDLFTEEELFTYESASTGQRFLNYLIDGIAMQYGLSYASGYLIGKIASIISPQWAYDTFVTRQNSFDVLFSMYLVSILNFLVYYTFCELLFKGRTLGKLVTGTRAVREDGKELTLKDAFLRTASRVVPFEPLSAFGGYPWHDKWTKTLVIKAR